MPPTSGVVWLCVLIFAVACIGADPVPSNYISRGDLRCYACTSYMNQCKDVVDNDEGDVFKSRCTSKCFTRIGEDGAIYRGCFDGFVEVKQLRYDYVGCRNQTWPGDNVMTWCMCDSDLCNSASMFQMRSYKSPLENTYKPPVTNDIEYGAKPLHNLPPIETNQYPIDNKLQSAAKEGDDAPEYGIHSNLQETNHRHDGTYPDDTQEIYPKDDKKQIESYHENEVDHQYEDYPFDKDNYYFTPSDQLNGHGAGPEAKGYFHGKVIQEPYYPFEANVYPSNGPSPSPKTEYEIEDKKTKYAPPAFPPHLVAKIPCAKTGYYQNPEDCRSFVACIQDQHARAPVMHLMRCPEGLVWDNKDKICNLYSSTCTAEDREYYSEDYGDGSQAAGANKYEYTEYEDKKIDETKSYY